MPHRPRRCDRHRHALGAGAVVIAALPASLAPTGAGGAAAPPPLDALPDPALPGDFPDPGVLAHDGGYVAYSTEVAGVNVPAAASSDLVSWTRLGDALPSLPSWARPGRTWAPAPVAGTAGGVLLYYVTRHAASGRQCTSVATAADPHGPFTDPSTAPLVCQFELGGSIDPSPFVAADGSRSLLFKSDETAIGAPSRIWSAPLTADGLALAGDPVVLLTADQPWEAGVVEGPAMAVVQGQHVLFYAGNWFESTYQAINVATCAGPTGPCAKRGPQPWFSATPGHEAPGAQAGPGGAAAFLDHGGRLLLAHHAWTAPRADYIVGGARSLRIAPIVVTGAAAPAPDEEPVADRLQAPHAAAAAP